MITILARVFAPTMVIATIALTGCATQRMIVSGWRNPVYTSASFRRIMVSGISGQASVRRNFEDEFVTQLRAVGVDALPSYRYIPDDEKIEDTRLKQAAREAGADALISVRPVSVEQKTELGPSYYPSPSFGVFGGNVAAVWHGLYDAPSVRRYNEYTSETTLHDVSRNEIVWTGTVRSTQPDNVNTATRSYVESVIKALNENNLLGVRK